MNVEYREVFLQAIFFYGYENQKDKAIEELSELINAIIKLKQKRVPKEMLVDEIADVEIMLDQLKLIHKCEENVLIRKDFKVKRLIERMKNETK